MKKAWSGRFSEETEKSVEMFTSSIPFDRRLWKYDIQGSIAHAMMLKKQKIIPSKNADSIIRSLKKIKKEIESGNFVFRDEFEDVHMNIEYALIRKTGTAGKMLHTARSRNDQVALDLRLYLRDEIQVIIDLIVKFQKVLVKAAERHIDIIMPGYTHLQKAQPVLLAHHLLAYFEMLERDHGRLHDCLKRVNVFPLGSCAMAGTTLPIDRKYTAKILKFPEISQNSIDAVSDRDFVVEFLSSSSLLMVHLSRFSEELVLWASEEFGFIELPDSFSTGSSIMPQKKNPDVLELVRGKTGRVLGDLMSILVVLKGLPLAYNRDMQEDKEPLFDTVDTLKACLSILIKMIPRIKFNKDVMAWAASNGFMTATDLAEYLVSKGVPFREAHMITGKAVSYCLKKGIRIEELGLSDLKRFSKAIDNDVYKYITTEASVNRRISHGGTARSNVLKRIQQIKSNW
jgi:argininosuccinate lyase